MRFYSIIWKIIICIGILFGIIVLFNDKQSLSLFRTIVFGFIPILISLVFFLLRKNKNIVIIVANSFLIVLLILSIFEVYLNYSHETGIKNSNNKNFINKKYCGNSLKKKENLPIYPLGGVSKKKIKFQNQENLSISFRESDRFGFNNQDDLWDFNNLNSVFIGDSFTYGADVNYFESFVEMYRKKENLTINLSCGGNGPIIEYATFVEYVKEFNLKPKYLFWVYYSGNDLQKDIKSEKNSFYAKYLNKGFNQNLIFKQDIIDKEFIKQIDLSNKKKNSKNLLKNNPSFNFIKFYKFKKIRTLIGLSSAYELENFQLFKEILIKLNDQIKNWEGKLIFVFIPSEKRYANLVSYYDEYFYDKNIEKFLKKEKIEYINLDDEFKKYDNPRNFFAGHLNVRGNEILSNLIIKKVEDLN